MDQESPQEERPRPKYGFLTKREYDAMGLGPESKAVTFYLPEGPEVFFRGKPSTTTRLHEIFHTTSTEETETPEGLAYEELRAHEYSKPERKTFSYNFVLSLVGTMVRRGYRPAKIMSSITSALDRMGYHLSKKGKREMLLDIRDYYETER